MTVCGRAVKSALILGLASILLTCGEESTAPESVTLDLFLSAPRDIRAVVVEIADVSLTPRAATGHSVFAHADSSATRLVIVADPGTTLSTSDRLVATLEGAGARRSSSYSARVTQAASADYRLRLAEGFVVRVERR